MTDKEVHWPNMPSNGRGELPNDARLGMGYFRELLLSARGHYQSAVDACNDWRSVAAAIKRRAGDDPAAQHVGMLRSMKLKELTDRRNFHLAMHRMVCQQIEVEMAYRSVANEANPVARSLGEGGFGSIYAKKRG